MRVLLSCLFLLLLSACGGGPDQDTLRADIEAQLHQAVPANAVEITAFQRMGSQKDLDAPEGESRRIVYFDMEFRLLEDVDFGAWGSPGISGLISALGAGPRGIEGITSGGNEAGDTISAHGTAVYREEDHGWVHVAAAGFQPPVVAPGLISDSPGGPLAALGAIREVLDAFPRDTSPEQNRIIEEELARAHSHIRARLARSLSGYSLAAGPEHGQYLRLARALFSDGGIRTVPLVTSGGTENLRLLRDGKANLALVQGDAAQDAFEGTGVFEEDGPNSSLRSVGSLYPEPIHILVRSADDLKTVKSLRGKRVAIGLKESASRITALRVLEAHGLNLEDIEALELSIGDALSALQQNEVDAVIQVIGTPADAIRMLQLNTPLRLLPLSSEAVEELVNARDGYFSYTIPAGSYPGIDHDIATVATAAILMTDTSLSEAEIESLTRHVFSSGHDYSAMGSAQAAQISVHTSRIGLSVPMHAAADRTLKGMAESSRSAQESVSALDSGSTDNPQHPAAQPSSAAPAATQNEPAPSETTAPTGKQQ